MKKTILLSLGLLLSGQVWAQKALVEGQITGLGNSRMYVRYYAGEVQKTDTLRGNNDHFRWEGAMSEPQKIIMMIGRGYAELYVEPGNIQVQGHVDSLRALRVSGSNFQKEVDAYQLSVAEIEKERTALYANYGKLSDSEQRQLEEDIAANGRKMRAHIRNFIEKNPESYFSLDLVEQRSSTGSYEDVQSIYSLLSPKMKANVKGKYIADRLDVLKRSAIGATIQDFSQKDLNGNEFHFSSLKGKYVLIDFWASWCGPCRAENPNVLKQYNRFKDKNFTVLGVSLDDKDEHWKKAVAEDGMPWIQVSDLKGWKNEVSTYFGVQAIPSTLLIGPDGRIIAKNLRGEMLAKKLEELFD